ncbi:hypothetical protein CDEST_03245 [Colletotrichum destructivum]|uniref:Uncharacterized protein n=1 Tax=Colletotrichum destructivum TaxID=34406 RepID=A0AAX4I4A8_9PEZI|nr:hypothetical protein CDEST_03245 [Colletotrichum destructivum]
MDGGKIVWAFQRGFVFSSLASSPSQDSRHRTFRRLSVSARRACLTGLLTRTRQESSKHESVTGQCLSRVLAITYDQRQLLISREIRGAVSSASFNPDWGSLYARFNTRGVGHLNHSNR